MSLFTDSTITDIDKLLAGISTGAFDRDLDDIATLVAERRKRIRSVTAQRNAAVLNVGDRVRVVGNLRPKYIVGCEGEVVKTNTTTVTVRFGANAGRFSHREVRVPANCLRRID